MLDKKPKKRRWIAYRIRVILVVTVLLTATFPPFAAAQFSDIAGWHSAPWGSTKTAFRKALGCNPSDFIGYRCTGGVYLEDCNPVPISTDPQRRQRQQEMIEIQKEYSKEKCAPPEADQFVIFDYPINGIRYEVNIAFTKGGLSLVMLTDGYSDPSAYETALAELRSRYGDPTPISTTDHLEWTWVKPHGNLRVSVYRDGNFTISYSRKKDKNTL